MTTRDSTPPAHAGLPVPSTQAMLDAVLALGRDLHLEMNEDDLVGRFVRLLVELFPDRDFAIRVLDLRATDHARVFAGRGSLRAGIERERISLKPSSVAKTRLKTALAESAWLKLSDRWDPPFSGVAAGFAVPLVASGEFYGVLDVGYPLGHEASERDEPLILPIANHLSIALRNERLHRDTTLLRDYQSKLIEHANALILGVDRHWRITVCNQALCRLTGFSAGELVGRDLRDWLPPEELPRLSKTFLQALAGGSADAVEAELLTESGGRARTVWSVASISARGQVQAVVAVGQDQTRVRELQNQVIQAEKLATLGQLAAGVVHELNNPLTSITVYAEYLLKKAQRKSRTSVIEDEADIDKLRRISAGAQRIQVFARDLVQYAKPAGVELGRVALDQVVRQSLSFCEHIFERAQVTLVEQHGADLPALDAVPGQLEQVVINLVTNAVQASVAGGRVTVSTFVDGSDLALAVEDTGPGVAEADRARVFEPFFTTKTDGRGTGLGLSIVKNIVEQHHGRVGIEAAAAGGARFVCRFPAARRA